MKAKYWLYLAALTFAMPSCNDDKLAYVLGSIVKAPEATIARVVKGHEQIYGVQAILRIAVKNGEGETYSAYDITSKVLPCPIIYQELELAKDDEGKVTIVSKRKHFDVILSPDFQYALELRYYDVNNQLINYQFGLYDPKDAEGSTLTVHQHFFSLQSYALAGQQGTYPMTPYDSLYYDEFTFAGGAPQPLTNGASTAIYVPEDHVPNTLRYSSKLAELAVKNAMSVEATKPQTFEGKTYKLCKTRSIQILNQDVEKVFSYEYRDTDPIEKELGKPVDGLDELGRQRAGQAVVRLRKNRSLDESDPYDALGFKGIITFKHPEMAFQMRVCICHVLTEGGKYNSYGETHGYNEISTAWNSFDIDYPLPFRVIGNMNDGVEKCLKDIERFYNLKPEDLPEVRKIVQLDGEYFRMHPQINF